MRARRLLLGLVGLATVGGATAWVLPGRAPLVSRPATRPAAVLVRNVSVVDVRAGTATAARDVWLEGDRIREIGPHDPRATVPVGAVVLEGAGRFLVPGLIDAHCHVGSSPEPPWDKGLPDEDLNLERLLYSGVTRIFDPGAMSPHIFEVRAELAAGARLGPRLHAAGPVFTVPGGHPEAMMRQMLPGLVVDVLGDYMFARLSAPADAEAAMQALLPHRPDLVKLAIDSIPLGVPRMSAELSDAVVRAAEAGGVRAVAHIGTYEDALQAAESGVAAWIHGVYKEPLSDAQVAKLASFGIPMVPTIVVFDSYARMGRGEFDATALEREVAPQSLLEARIERPADFPVEASSLEFLDLLRAQRQAGLDNARRLHAAGVTLLAGSDAQASVVHGPALHRELALLVKAGLPTAEVLRAATYNPARFLADAEDPEYGEVAEGKLADLLLVAGDPLEDIESLSKIEAVILGGEVLDRHPLEQR